MSLIKALKFLVKFCQYLVQKILLFNYKPTFEILSVEETLDMIINARLSVVRYGDGELLYISGKKLPSGYQQQDKILRDRLEIILKSNNIAKFLICMPEPLVSVENIKFKSKIYWTDVVFKERSNYEKLLGSKVYGNSFISRPYMAYKDNSNTFTIFNKLKKIWANRSILIVEGEFSRTGVGNDLFDVAKSVFRIICPSSDAFSVRKEIKSEILNYVYANKKEDLLILLALGPTAKVLTFELLEVGIQVIDIGHIDSEYEWFLRGANQKVIIEGKHTAENDGILVPNCQDEVYINSIITRIER